MFCILHHGKHLSPQLPLNPLRTSPTAVKLPLKLPFKSSPEAGRTERFLSIHLAYAEPLEDETETKQYGVGRGQGINRVKVNVSGVGNISCLTSASVNVSAECLMTEKGHSEKR